jgi:uncharacterized membrane protein
LHIDPNLTGFKFDIDFVLICHVGPKTNPYSQYHRGRLVVDFIIIVVVVVIEKRRYSKGHYVSNQSFGQVDALATSDERLGTIVAAVFVVGNTTSIVRCSSINPTDGF